MLDVFLKLHRFTLVWAHLINSSANHPVTYKPLFEGASEVLPILNASSAQAEHQGSRPLVASLVFYIKGIQLFYSTTLYKQ